MPEGSPYALYTRDQLEKEAMRNQKIIVALFLFLGKAIIELPVKKRNLQVKESEIRKAWSEKKSPVRILSEALPTFEVYDAETQQGYGGFEERLYKVFLQDLDLNKVGFMHPHQKCPNYEANPTGPAPNVENGERRRVFDLE